MTVGADRYSRCPACLGTLKDGPFLSAEEERAYYDRHENRLDDAGYRAFLDRLAAPLLARLSGSADILDFGCGPGPLLARMLEAAGHRVTLYDPHYAPDPAALERRYDVVTASEVVEHFRVPAAAFRSMAGLLRPGGRLAVMTCFQTDDARFAGWNYRRDPTHVAFYRAHTLLTIGECLGLATEIVCKDVAIFTRAKAQEDGVAASAFSIAG